MKSHCYNWRYCMLGATSGCLYSESKFSPDISLLREATGSPDELSYQDWFQPAESSLLWTRAWPEGDHGCVRRAINHPSLLKMILRNVPGAFCGCKESACSMNQKPCGEIFHSCWLYFIKSPSSKQCCFIFRSQITCQVSCPLYFRWPPSHPMCGKSK